MSPTDIDTAGIVRNGSASDEEKPRIQRPMNLQQRPEYCQPYQNAQERHWKGQIRNEEFINVRRQDKLSRDCEGAQCLMIGFLQRGFRSSC